MGIRVIHQRPTPDGIITTYANGHVKVLPYPVDENGDQYIELDPNNEFHPEDTMNHSIEVD